MSFRYPQAMDRDSTDEEGSNGTAREQLENYWIMARVLPKKEALPMGAEVQAEIIIRRETFWRHMLRRVMAR